MPAWPGHWDGQETFEAALRAWEVSPPASSEVLTEAKRWIGTRQDNPYDSDMLEDGDVRTVRAWVRDLFVRPIRMNGGYVACVYEIYEDEHRLKCLYFTIRAGGRPAG
jgi:hypothetical protein